MKKCYCLTGQYLNWTKSRSTIQCWWCPCRTQTRDHLVKVCPELETQQKIVWAEVRGESGRGKSRFKIRDLLADERSSQAVPDFLSTAAVGKLVPAEEDAGSEVSDWERRERRELEEEQRVETDELGVAED